MGGDGDESCCYCFDGYFDGGAAFGRDRQGSWLGYVESGCSLVRFEDESYVVNSYVEVVDYGDLEYAGVCKEVDGTW
ncbi:Uncharacterised protein [Dermatophilus congolensis]|uniref:Uncharacterized protein n=1 Tax=Dermatophilus congolensis TaxID=1863 RepID=A0AA46BQ52_9MICO|nr:Uncharacterised protein [Dermatophilus congolensis]